MAERIQEPGDRSQQKLSVKRPRSGKIRRVNTAEFR
jgi:hypothetical protein